MQTLIVAVASGAGSRHREAIVVGSHRIKNRSKTQSVIATSSADSELHGVVKGACRGLGATMLLKDLGIAGVKARMHLDATAAKGMSERRGLNKARHIETDVLWLQEQEARRR